METLILARKGTKRIPVDEKNAHKFGFHQVYTNKKKTKRSGYEEENGTGLIFLLQINTQKNTPN